jgi:hypothetical protein
MTIRRKLVRVKQMLRRRHINGDPEGRGVRLLSGAVDAVRWPFERAVWAVERGVLWPLRERVAGGWSALGRGTGAGVLAGIVAAVVLASVFLLPGGGDEPSQQIAAPARVALASPDSQLKSEQPSGPVLKGAAPSFGVGEGVGVAQAGDGAGAELNAGGGDEVAGADDETAQPEEAAATTSSKKPVPAGPAAMKVARRFSEAFVFYEVGEKPARAKTVFGETAAPELATALGERPPRLPADAKVPKARVLNLVPGPRAGKAYTVSVSLLRVGLTSELRLELNKQKGQWLVTDVRG